MWSSEACDRCLFTSAVPFCVFKWRIVTMQGSVPVRLKMLDFKTQQTKNLPHPPKKNNSPWEPNSGGHSRDTSTWQQQQQQQQRLDLNTSPSDAQTQVCRQVWHQHRCQRGRDTRAGNKTEVVSKPESYNIVKENNNTLTQWTTWSSPDMFWGHVQPVVGDKVASAFVSGS